MQEVIILLSINILLVLFIITSFIISMRKESKNYSQDMPIISDITCPICQSNNIKERLHIAESFRGSKVGAKYLINRKRIGLNVLHCAPLHADICMQCGTVVRLYIDVPKQADWIYGDSAFSKK